MSSIQEIVNRLSKKHNVSRGLLEKLEKESKKNQYENRSEAKKIHELESLITIQLKEDQERN